jgi:hypothetical protein
LPKIGQKGYDEIYIDESTNEKQFKHHDGMMSYPPGSMETAANIGASQTTIPTTGVYHPKQELPGIMYLDHAQIKLMLRRITHVKELLASE